MRSRVFLAAVAVSLAFVGAELAAGGFSYGADPSPKPCEKRESVPGEGIDPLGQRLTLRAVDAIACRLGMSREQLVLELAERGEGIGDWRDVLRDRVGNLLDRLEDFLGG